MAAAAAGTIILTVIDPTIKPDHPNHLFTSLGGQFDSGLCRTPTAFTILPNVGHVLITDLDQIYGTLLQTPDGLWGPISLNNGIKTPLRLCYGVYLTSSNMMLHVGKDTSLSLLLRSGCLRVTSFTVNQDQMAQLIRSAFLPTFCPTPIVRMAGSITLTMKKDQKAPMTTPMKRKQQIRFMCLSEHFDPEQCFSQKEFTVNPNEEHVLLLMNHGKIAHKILLDKNRIWINDRRPGKYLGFSISLKQPDMTLTVGEKTPLSLLMNSGTFNIVPFFMAGSQYVLLMEKNEPMMS